MTEPKDNLLPPAAFANARAEFAKEAELLLCCGRPSIDQATAERIRQIVAAGPDWDEVFRMSMSHSLLPLVCQNLKDVASDFITKQIHNRLERYYQAHALNNRFLSIELVKILKLLESNGVPALPYKGPALAVVAYGNVALRQFGDLDVLVPKPEFDRAKELLIAHGYRPDADRRAEEEDDFVHSHHDYALVRGDGRVVVELHWALTEWSFSMPFEFQSAWQSSETVALCGTTVRSLSMKDLIPALSIHGSLHMWDRLMWIADLAALMRARPELDWGGLVATARSCGVARMMLLGFRLAGGLLGATLPAPVRQAIAKDTTLDPLALQVSRQLFPGRNMDRSWPEEATFLFKLHESSSSRFGYLMHHDRRYLRYRLQCIFSIFKPTRADREFVALPDALSFLYYAVRPFRLVRDYGVKGVVGRLISQS